MAGLNAFVSENQLFVGHVRLKDKENEITATRQLLDKIDVEDAVVSIDAFHQFGYFFARPNNNSTTNASSSTSCIPIPPINNGVMMLSYLELSNVNSSRLSISSKAPKSEVTFPIGITLIPNCPMSGSSALA